MGPVHILHVISRENVGVSVVVRPPKGRLYNAADFRLWRNRQVPPKRRSSLRCAKMLCA